MKDERETRQRLLACAKKEFMDKGYTAASLRGICRKADVTTGALYFFFKDKADLFAALVEEPVNRLYELMTNHYRDEINTELQDIHEEINMTNDIKAAIDILHYMYQNYDEFWLVLGRSQGSGYESCKDRFVDITQKHYRILADRICRQRNYPLLDDYVLHWMAHMHIDTVIHMLTHEPSEETACRHMEQTVRYLVSGFYGMLQP